MTNSWHLHTYDVTLSNIIFNRISSTIAPWCRAESQTQMIPPSNAFQNFLRGLGGLCGEEGTPRIFDLISVCFEVKGLVSLYGHIPVQNVILALEIIIDFNLTRV